MNANNIIKWSALGLVAVVTGLLVACSGGDEKTSAPSVCDQWEAVQADAQELADIDLLAEGTNELKNSLANLRTDLNVLGDVVSDDVAGEVQDLKDALSNAEGTLAGVDEKSLGDKVGAVSSALADVATAVAALATALNFDCG